MEARYRETLTERSRTAATLELELEKERQRVKGYKQALISHSQQLMEERKQLQQERETLEEEKQKLVRSGAAGAVLHRALEREQDWYQRATATLKELEGQLVERQNAYCSLIQPRDQRLEMERNMLLKVVKDPIGAEIDLESDLKDIFKRDKHCADVLNMDKRKNGSLMWVYLKYWQLQVTLQKHKKAEETILGGKIQSHRDPPPGAVDLYRASLFGCCHPQDAVQEAGGLFWTLQLLKLTALVHLRLELRQKAGAIDCQRWSCTNEKHRYLLSPALSVQ
ncbi:hypothetical protein INR49_012865 [Caranx melampygus]|nr:hypothetical protein INR49_012865 [Caranx melampygus]